ncbi:DUF5753 domain-containing protein [Actinomadura bangladeshensis]|uniref:DUF5753 domain-containing protein n=1 Tax=Actinomadura bangladeshensis TaxID=453573 RepID=A0A4R4NV97_9ACTN|nr:DUF5753 domain-containing protein [Actinomadura bangladeshensis]TDC12030.1 hypothetical protein E1284_25625 [Actinomadura bangladeshensis]
MTRYPLARYRYGHDKAGGRLEKIGQNVTKSDQGERYSTVVALLNRDRDIAGRPPFAEIERISSALTGRTVYGVTVQQVPRATANDVMRGKHTSRLRFPVVASLWAVMHHIAAQRGIDIQAMTPWEELDHSFHQPRPTATASTAPPEWRHARQESASPCQAPAGRPDQASGRGTGLTSCDPLAASVGPGAPFFSVTGERPTGQSPRQAARELLARVRAEKQVWWHDYRPVVPHWFGPYLTLERLLSLIRVYAPHRVPGLLQAPGYARHLITQDLPGVGADELARRIELRQVRQQILHRPDAPTYWAVIDLRALGEHAAPPEVLREQIQYLISMAAYPHVIIQLLRGADAERAVPDGPLTLMRFPETALADIAFFEHYDYGHYVDDSQTSEELSLRFHRLAARALKPPDSVTWLLHMHGQL